MSIDSVPKKQQLRYYIKLRVLHVDDNPMLAKLVKKLLSEVSYADFEVVWVANMRDALQQLDEESQREATSHSSLSCRWDCILLDLTLPDSVGAATFEAIYRNTEAPIVVLTAEHDIEVRAAVVAAGAQDCVFKLEMSSTDVLARSIRFAVERYRTIKELRRAVRELEASKELMEELLRDGGDSNFLHPSLSSRLLKH